MASYCRPVPGCAPVADIWQFTSSSSIKGISGDVDESRYVGTRGLTWQQLADGTKDIPWPSAAPKPPRAPSVTPGPTTATVSWLPGNFGSARVKRYTVTSEPGGITAKANGASTTATVEGLDPATSYTFTVTATSKAGSSQPSDPTAAITPTVPTLLTLTQPADIDYGSRLTIGAVLTRSDTSNGVGGQEVTVYRRAAGAAKWHKRGTETTESDGSIALKMHPKKSLELRLAFKGSPGYERDNAKGATVVHSVVSAELSKAKVRHGKHVKLRGAVAPVIEGTQVVRQRLVGSTWRDGPTKTVKKDGTFSFRLHPKHKKRTLTYRILVPAANRLGAGASPILTLVVK
jgi:hypothetical protein